MGIVVCISMLLGLSVLQPTPWNRVKRSKHDPRFALFTAIALLILGAWNFIYGYLNISGFWFWASMISGAAMVFASYFIFIERTLNAHTSGLQADLSIDDNSDTKALDVDITGRSATSVRKAVVVVLALSFLVYAVTLVQLNLGYPILR